MYAHGISVHFWGGGRYCLGWCCSSPKHLENVDEHFSPVRQVKQPKTLNLSTRNNPTSIRANRSEQNPDWPKLAYSIHFQGSWLPSRQSGRTGKKDTDKSFTTTLILIIFPSASPSAVKKWSKITKNTKVETFYCSHKHWHYTSSLITEYLPLFQVLNTLETTSVHWKHWKA